MGVCTSYNTMWKYLKQLTNEARYLEMIRSGHWLWVYDNLNLMQSIRHEREGMYIIQNCTTYEKLSHNTSHTMIDHHSSMMNVTSRLAVKIGIFLILSSVCLITLHNAHVTQSPLKTSHQVRKPPKHSRNTRFNT